MPAALFVYTTNLASLAPVTEDGTVTAKTAGVIRVKATLWGSSFANEISVQAVPARMEITPAVAQLSIGERRSFTFKAFDVDGREVPTPAVTWTILHGNGYQSVAASVTSQGAVTAYAESDLVLQAGFSYDPNLAGFQRQSYATIPLKIRPREYYRLRKIPLPSENPGGLYRGMRMNNISPNETGRYVDLPLREPATPRRCSGMESATNPCLPQAGKAQPGLKSHWRNHRQRYERPW